MAVKSPYRIPLIVSLAVLVGFTLLFINYSLSAPDRTYTSNKAHVDSGYMEDQQYPFAANTNLNCSDPTVYCNCYATTPPLSTEELVSIEQGAESQPLIVPDAFKQPPAALMDKINANLQDNRVLIVAAANYGMRNHAYNWIESLLHTGEDKFLILCLDDQLYDHLHLAGFGNHAAKIPDTWLHQQIEAGFEEYYSQKYRVITHAKTLVVQQLLYLDINVLFSDVDIVWLKPRIREYLHTLLAIRDDTQVIFQQEGAEQKEVNSGFYIMRPSEPMKRLLASTIYLADQDSGLTQQGALNRALDALDLRMRTTAVVLLDVLQWPNGYIYFENNWNNAHGVDPYIIHANYLIGDAKKNRLQQAGFWYIDDQWLEGIDQKLDASKTTTTIEKEDKKAKNPKPKQKNSKQL